MPQPSPMPSAPTPPDQPDPIEPQTSPVQGFLGGALGIGVVLVLLPSVALYLGFEKLNQFVGTGLPIVTLFGIMVLVGSLALTSTLFRRLGLARRSQPLALPPGSVRATIALALIVLFAIIAASVLRPSGEPYKISGLTGAQKDEMLRDTKLPILSVIAEPCAVAPKPDVLGMVPECAAGDHRFGVMVRPGLTGSTLDLAKELLTLIGQLMTMAVSFYFAARTAAKPPEIKPVPDPKPEPKPEPKPVPAPKSTPVAGPAQTPAAPSPQDTDAGSHDDHVDGCNVVIDNPTPDSELPATRGGVAKP